MYASQHRRHHDNVITLCHHRRRSRHQIRKSPLSLCCLLTSILISLSFSLWHSRCYGYLPRTGPLNTDALRRASIRLAERHVALRTVFSVDGATGQHVQVMCSPAVAVSDFTVVACDRNIDTRGGDASKTYSPSHLLRVLMPRLDLYLQHWCMPRHL